MLSLLINSVIDAVERSWQSLATLTRHQRTWSSLGTRTVVGRGDAGGQARYSGDGDDHSRVRPGHVLYVPLTRLQWRLDWTAAMSEESWPDEPRSELARDVTSHAADVAYGQRLTA